MAEQADLRAGRPSGALAGHVTWHGYDLQGEPGIHRGLPSPYLTFIVTASLLPLEVYELSQRVSVLKMITIVINLAVVAYLLFAKRLFGLRGGAEAEEELRRRDVGIEALLRTTP